jgi:predicted HTH domain antitoxin
MKTVTLELPDELASQLPAPGQDLAQAALEALAVVAYREHRITAHQIAALLKLDRYELDGFLKSRGVWLEYTLQDLERDREVSRRLMQKRQSERESPPQR